MLELKKTISRIIPKHGLQETAKIQGKSWIYETRNMPKHNPLICTHLEACHRFWHRGVTIQPSSHHQYKPFTSPCHPTQAHYYLILLNTLQIYKLIYILFFIFLPELSMKKNFKSRLLNQSNIFKLYLSIEQYKDYDFKRNIKYVKCNSLDWLFNKASMTFHANVTSTKTPCQS